MQRLLSKSQNTNILAKPDPSRIKSNRTKGEKSKWMESILDKNSIFEKQSEIKIKNKSSWKYHYIRPYLQCSDLVDYQENNSDTSDHSKYNTQDNFGN